MSGPKKSIAYLTPERLDQLAQEPQNVVYNTTYDIQYTPWSGERVTQCVNKIVTLTRSGSTPAELRSTDKEIDEFASKYTVFFAKLSDPVFANDRSHVRTVLELIKIKIQLDNGEINENEARGRSASLALVSLQMRVPPPASKNEKKDDKEDEKCGSKVP